MLCRIKINNSSIINTNITMCIFKRLLVNTIAKISSTIESIELSHNGIKRLFHRKVLFLVFIRKLLSRLHLSLLCFQLNSYANSKRIFFFASPKIRSTHTQSASVFYPSLPIRFTVASVNAFALTPFSKIANTTRTMSSSL